MDTTDMVEPVQDVQDVQENMDKHKRYYILHREEANARRLIRYHNNPKVIAKKEERERKKAEKEAQKELEKEAKLLEKARKHEELIQLALATKKKMEANPNPPVEEK
jgi:hypothetical protein